MKLRKQCVISISYFNYLFSIGGTDKFIIEQKQFCNKNGYDYIYVYSSDFLMDKLHLPRRNKWVVLVNDKQFGIFSKNELIFFFKDLETNCSVRLYFVNHMMNINANELEDIFYKKNVPISIFIHDYYTLCPHSGLIDDSGIYCNNVKQNSKCQCRGINHKFEDDFTNMFYSFLNHEKHRISIYFPSEIAKKIWLRGYPEFVDSCNVLPHYNIVEWKTLEPRNVKKELSIAYVGNASSHKGYQKWKAFVDRIKEKNSAINLYHFGICNEKLANVMYVDIDYSKEEEKLTNKLLKYGIDCVVLWSLVPETYSYTYYESYSADCFILTNCNSGNIASQVGINGNGFVSDDIDGLFDIVSDDEGFHSKLDNYFGNKRSIPFRMENNFIDLPSGKNFGISSYKRSMHGILHFYTYVILEYFYKIIRKIRRNLNK